MIPILLYHRFTRLANSPDRYSLHVDYFKNHLDFLDSRKWICVSELNRGNGEVGISLTVDDGYRCLVDLALPEMEKKGAKGTFFLIAGLICNDRRFITKQEIRRLANTGHEIGSHGLTHRHLTFLGKTELNDELASSKAILEDFTGSPVTSLSLPFGEYNRRVIENAQALGYEFICTSEFGLNDSSNHEVLRRLTVYSGDSGSILKGLVDPSSSFFRKRDKRARFLRVVRNLVGYKAYAWMANRGKPDTIIYGD